MTYLFALCVHCELWLSGRPAVTHPDGGDHWTSFSPATGKEQTHLAHIKVAGVESMSISRIVEQLRRAAHTLRRPRNSKLEPQAANSKPR